MARVGWQLAAGGRLMAFSISAAVRSLEPESHRRRAASLVERPEAGQRGAPTESGIMVL